MREDHKGIWNTEAQKGGWALYVFFLSHNRKHIIFLDAKIACRFVPVWPKNCSLPKWHPDAFFELGKCLSSSETDDSKWGSECADYEMIALRAEKTRKSEYASKFNHIVGPGRCVFRARMGGTGWGLGSVIGMWAGTANPL